MKETVYKYKVASLFAGIGGIDLAFKQAGFKISWANDNDSKACDTYRCNFRNEIICEDIKKLSYSKLEAVDIITAGFPCQPFSIAGERKGFEDDRGILFFDLMNLVKYLKPRVLFLENVKNIKSCCSGEIFELIMKCIKALGYKVKYQVMNSYKYSDIPQNRERIYMVCFLHDDDYHRFTFPEKADVLMPFQELIDAEVADDKYYYHDKPFSKLLKEGIKNHNTFYQWRRSYIRENKCGLCPTLTASMGTGGHNVPIVVDNKGIRKITPRECARLQGFDDSFIFPIHLSDSSLYKQLGNSVTVPVVRAIANQILIALNK